MIMRAKFLAFPLVLLSLPGWLLIAEPLSQGLSDPQLEAVRVAFDGRRDEVLKAQVDHPYPEIKPAEGKKRANVYYWHHLDFALGALWRNERLGEANEAILKACRAWSEDPKSMAGDKGFYWSGNLFLRIYELFHQESRFFPGRLKPDTEAAMAAQMWSWADARARIAEAEIQETRTWRFWSSENHDAMRKTTAWGTTKILKDIARYRDRRLGDGYTPQEHYTAWTQYFREYLRERAKKGGLMEIASPTYLKYTLQGWHNFYDFSPDQTLKRRAGQMLDLFWAVWAQDQIDAVRGGGKARSYQREASQRASGDALYGLVWYYLGIGKPLSQHPALMTMVTSAYRMPAVVMDLALDIEGRGSFESVGRRMGLSTDGKDNATQEEQMRTDTGGIVRYGWHTPDFVLGTLLVEARPNEDWRAGSAQNRWQGVIFRGSPDARIYPQCVGGNDEKTYNQHWSVQKKGTLIAQKLQSGRFSSRCNDMRVWISEEGLTLRLEEKGWVFVEASGAWAAIHPVRGGYDWDPKEERERGRWFRLHEELSPIIFEVARKKDIPSFEDFHHRVLSNKLVLTKSSVTYTGLSGDSLTLFSDYSQPPQINGREVDFAPPKTFDSPFIQEDWNEGMVTIAKGTRILKLDFNEE